MVWPFRQPLAPLCPPLPPPSRFSPLPRGGGGVQCPVIPPPPKKNRPDASWPLVALQTRTSTPRGTPAAGSGRWGDSGDGEPWEKAPSWGGAACGQPAPLCAPSPPGGSAAPELKMGDPNKSPSPPLLLPLCSETERVGKRALGCGGGEHRMRAQMLQISPKIKPRGPPTLLSQVNPLGSPHQAPFCGMG